MAEQRWADVLEHLRDASALLDVCGLDSIQPTHGQLQHHVDRALRWAEEMELLLSEEDVDG